jgi:hypothetical protein
LDSSLLFLKAQSDISFTNEYEPTAKSQSVLARPQNKLGIVYGRDAGLLNMLNLSIFIGIQTDVLVVDGGNRFDPHYVAYGIRRFTHWWEEVAERTHIVRAFTCYEVVKALQEVPHEPYPLLVIDMLATFYDENVNDGESLHLVNKCAKELKRILEYRPVVISLTPLPAEFESRKGLNEIIEKLSDGVFNEENIANPIYQASLF